MLFIYDEMSIFQFYIVDLLFGDIKTVNFQNTIINHQI